MPLPPADASTYRDLLLFEERLKTNAASLQRRKRRYQLVFLGQLVLVILLLLTEIAILQPYGSSLLAFPHAFMLSRLAPESYDTHHPAILNPYLATGLLFVSVTTLALFFASGMYRDKIAYANRYVPQANRALRSFNMYLNVRMPPFRSRFSLSFIRSPSTPSTSPPRSSSPSPPSSRSRSSSSVISHPINPIPPANNPRGELIFSSRVDRSFREGYEKHRAAFERRRGEKEKREKIANSWLWKLFFWRKLSPPQSAANPSAPTARLNTAATSSSPRGRGTASRSPTPDYVRKSRKELSPSPLRASQKDMSLRR